MRKERGVGTCMKSLSMFLPKGKNRGVKGDNRREDKELYAASLLCLFCKHQAQMGSYQPDPLGPREQQRGNKSGE